ncbi:MAG: heparinase II/III domain-containing protein [Vicinamibacterales bacterium]
MKRLDKLRRMSRREIAWRTGAALRVQRDRALTRLRSPRWDRARLRNMLASDVLDPLLLTHLERRDWSAAHRSLARTLRAKPRLFVLDPHAALGLRHEILLRWPRASADASSRANRILEGRYDLLGYRGLSFAGEDGAVDWHVDPVHSRRAPKVFWSEVPYLDPRVGDHKVIWELNRHQHWLTLGRALWLTRDRRYAWAIVSQLQSWLDANPPLTGINWASSLELGLRSLSWLWAIDFLLADSDEGAAGPSHSPWLVDLLLALGRQLAHLEQNLSYYFSPNTHLTGEGLALYVAGLSLPELAGSQRWTATGRRILLAEIDRQISADGGHAERSTHYHRYTLDFYLLALVVAERSNDLEAITRFTDAACRAAGFARAMADDRGRLPLIGDDDGGMLWPIAGRASDDIRDSLALAAVLLGRPDFAPWGVPEEVFWIAGLTAIDQQPFIDARRTDAAAITSRALTDTGYVVARDGAGGHLVFDLGAHGYMNGGHAHADALSITLGVGGRPLLVDPGTSTYTMKPAIRDRLRRTANHNTLTLDGRPSSMPSGPFGWRSHADAQSGDVRLNAAFDWAEGWHDGYAGNRHRRSVFRAPAGGWLIVDEVLGRGTHAADLHWHLDPAWMVSAETPTRLRASHLDGCTAWIVHDGDESFLLHGDDESGLGWCAPVYGTLVPTWTVRVSRAGIAPFAIVTWIACAADAPSLTHVATESDTAGSAPIAIRVLQGPATWITMLRPGEPPMRETRGCGVEAYHTDGRLLHYGSRDGRLLSLAACDAHHVLALREGWLSVAADGHMPDLHLESRADRIDAWTSSPTERLRLQGDLVTAVRSIRLNGRELPAAARERADSAIALASDWGEPGRTPPCVASPVSPI